MKLANSIQTNYSTNPSRFTLHTLCPVFLADFTFKTNHGYCNIFRSPKFISGQLDYSYQHINCNRQLKKTIRRFVKFSIVKKTVNCPYPITLDGGPRGLVQRNVWASLNVKTLHKYGVKK